MPWKSDKQRRWGHTKDAIKTLGIEKVKEYDRMTKGKDLPEKVRRKKK